MDFEKLVSEALRRSNNNRKEAREYIKDRADDDDELNDVIRDRGADSLISAYGSATRHRVDTKIRINIPHPLPKKWNHTAALKKILNSSGPRNYWQNYRLWGAEIRLVDATRPQLIESAGKHGKTARTHRERAEYERQIAAQLPNDTITVGEAVRTGVIRELPNPPQRRVRPRLNDDNNDQPQA